MPLIPNDSQVTLHKSGGVTLQGPDAMRLFQAAQLKASLGLYAKTGMVPTRGFGITRMLNLTSQITGKPYLRGKAGAPQAIEDLQKWIDTMKAALPVEDNR